MLRVLWVLFLLLVLAGLVAAGVADGWTVTHVGITGCVGLLAVLALIPTKKEPAAAGAGAGRRGR